ncbi:MAG: M48 family metallopeptidase [Elusimicrobiota bacterium]
MTQSLTEEPINLYLLLVLAIITAGYIFSFIVDKLNVSSAVPGLPEEFKGFYDGDKYAKAQAYLKENTDFGLLTSGMFACIELPFIILGGFNFADRIARGFGYGEIATGLIFAGLLLGAAQILKIPFSAHHTFGIEEKYGFNKTTVKTFILDIIKSWALSAVIGGLVFALILWFFMAAGGFAWVYCWIAVALFEIFIVFIAPVTIMPLFNKFVPLEEGELRDSLQRYADSQGFKLAGIYKMDGSKRSTKANAFFTGFGRFKRIALFDTLIAKHTVDELVSILAHEVGHFKKRHIAKSLLVSFLSSGLMFFILSMFMNNPGLFAAFRMENISIYASIIFFGFLYSPINSLISVIANVFSRKWEYEADDFAAASSGKREAFINAMKKLSVDNLSNLTPHPLKVFLDYSHPPVLQRIERLKR